MWLPDPVWMAATSGVLFLAAAAVFFLAHLIRLSLAIAGAALVLSLCAGVAFGYEKMGEDKIRPQLEIAEEKLRRAAAQAAQFEIEANVALQKASRATAAKNKAINKLKVKTKEYLDAQAKWISDTVVPAPVVVFLNAAIADVNDSAFGPGAGNEAGANTSVPPPANVRQWEEWSAEVVQLYGKCVGQVDGLQSYINDLNAAGQRAKASLAGQ